MTVSVSCRYNSQPQRQVIHFVIPAMAEVQQIKVAGPSVGQYALQYASYTDGQIQVVTTRPISWRESPEGALQALVGLQNMSIVQVRAEPVIAAYQYLGTNWVII